MRSKRRLIFSAQVSYHSGKPENETFELNNFICNLSNFSNLFANNVFFSQGHEDWSDDDDVDDDDDDDDNIVFEDSRVGADDKVETTSDDNDNDDEVDACPNCEPDLNNSEHFPAAAAAAKKDLHFMYIQMEFCDKQTLRSAIDGDLFKDAQRVWRMFREVIEGLLHIHSQGMIHRDLKPVNIFLDRSDHVKIGDFGLATTNIKALGGGKLTVFRIILTTTIFFNP